MDELGPTKIWKKNAASLKWFFLSWWMNWAQQRYEKQIRENICCLRCRVWDEVVEQTGTLPPCGCPVVPSRTYIMPRCRCLLLIVVARCCMMLHDVARKQYTYSFGYASYYGSSTPLGSSSCNLSMKWLYKASTFDSKVTPAGLFTSV